jgi:hypothetical protein
MDDLQITPQGDNPVPTDSAQPTAPVEPVAPVPEAPGMPISLSDAQPVPEAPALTQTETVPTEVPAMAPVETPVEAAIVPAETPAAEATPAETPGMAVSEAVVPKKSGLLKTVLIAGAVLVVVGAAGAAVFFGKGGPFKGQLEVTNMTNAPLRFATDQNLCPTDEYKPMVSLMVQPDGLVSAGLFNSSIPKANAAFSLQNLSISPSSFDAPLSSTLLLNPPPPPPPPIMVQTMTMQTTPAATCTAITITPSQLYIGQTALSAKVTYSDGKSYSTVVTWTGIGGTFINNTIQEQQSSADFMSTFATSSNVEGSSATAKVTGATGANNSPACQEGVTVSTPPPILVQSITMQTVETVQIINPVSPPPVLIETMQTTEPLVCEPIPHDNLTPGGEQCILVDTLYGSPDSYLLNDETKSHLNEWYSTCHPPVETSETQTTSETMPVPPVTQAVLECGQNEIMSDAVCVCSQGFERNGDTEKCEYDCSAALNTINSLKSSPTTESTPEASAELNRLESAYSEFECQAPPTEEISQCRQFQNAATEAFDSGNWDTYLTSINLYIDNNCSGRTDNQCDALLAEASTVSTVLNYTAESPSHAKYLAQLGELRASYYADAECANPDRCSALEPIYGGSQEPSGEGNLQSSPDVVPSLVPVYLELTPGSVFNDDQQYYNENCKPLSCEEIRAKYTGVDLNSLDITPEKRASYAACLVVPEETPTIVSPLAPPPSGGGRPPGYVPPAPPSPPTIVSPIISPPAPPPAVTPPVVVTQTQAIEPVKAPIFPIKTIITPAPAPAPTPEPAPALRPSAPEEPKPVVVKDVPPEITPTGPEVYIYLIGFIGIQLFLFRRKILAWVITRSK